MRALLPAAACCFAAVLAGCGGHKPRATKPPRPVALTIAQPSDTAVVESETVDVRGTVGPVGAHVRVLGRPATVSGSAFSIDGVPLDPGANVVDVIATAPRRAPLLTALRVTRVILVTVPKLEGSGQDDAASALRKLGLRLDARRGPDGFIDALLPGAPKVCDQQPAAGARVRKGTAVRVLLSKSC